MFLSFNFYIFPFSIKKTCEGLSGWIGSKFGSAFFTLLTVQVFNKENMHTALFVCNHFKYFVAYHLIIGRSMLEGNWHSC